MKTVVLLGLAGALFALGLGFAGWSVARDTIALPAVALEAGKPLAPATAPPAHRDRTPRPTTTATTTRPATTRDDGRARTTTDDDSGTSGRGGSDDSDGGKGRGRNRGRGADD